MRSASDSSRLKTCPKFLTERSTPMASEIVRNAPRARNRVAQQVRKMRVYSERILGLPSGLARARAEHVPYAANGADQRVPCAVKFPAQVADVDVQRPFVRRRLALMQNRRDLVARHDPARRPHEQLEDVELDRGELHLLTEMFHLPALDVHHDVSHLDDVAAAWAKGARAPQPAFAPRQQLAGFERLLATLAPTP